MRLGLERAEMGAGGRLISGLAGLGLLGVGYVLTGETIESFNYARERAGVERQEGVAEKRWAEAKMFGGAFKENMGMYDDLKINSAPRTEARFTTVATSQGFGALGSALFGAGGVTGALTGVRPRLYRVAKKQNVVIN